MRRERCLGTGNTARYTLTIPEAARTVGVPRSTLYRWIDQGRLHPREVDGVMRARPADVTRLRRVALATGSARVSAEAWARLRAAGIEVAGFDGLVDHCLRLLDRCRSLRGRIRELEAARATEAAVRAAER